MSTHTDTEITGAVNLGHDGSLKLVTSNPPAAEMANQTRYVLRFKPPTGQGGFVASDPDLSSPGFLLVRPTAVAPGTATATPVNYNATPSRQIPTSVPGSISSTPNMTPAAAAGLTIGLVFVVALLVAMEVAYLMWRRKRRRLRQREGTDGAGATASTPSRRRGRLWRRGKGDDPDRGLFVQVDKAEMVVVNDALWLSPELPGDSDWGQRLVYELQGSRLGRGNPFGRTLTINSSVVELEVNRRR